jgi:hypothetical protein
MHSKQNIFIFVFSVLLFFMHRLYCAPGDVDPTFGSYGVRMNSGEFITSTTVQLDDSLITVGLCK